MVAERRRFAAWGRKRDDGGRAGAAAEVGALSSNPDRRRPHLFRVWVVGQKNGLEAWNEML